jgi:hypothetical protein
VTNTVYPLGYSAAGTEQWIADLMSDPAMLLIDTSRDERTKSEKCEKEGWQEMKNEACFDLGKGSINYEPNTVRWQPGAVVIHDADAKKREMLMVVTGYHRKTGACRTKYLHPEHLPGMRRHYLNDIRYLHDPARFGLQVESAELKEGMDMYEQLIKKVMTSCYLRQETDQIDGVKYVLDKGNAASTERWTLWRYPEDRSPDFIAADYIEDLFQKAAEQGVPVEKLMLDQWHD